VILEHVSNVGLSCLYLMDAMPRDVDTLSNHLLRHSEIQVHFNTLEELTLLYFQSATIEKSEIHELTVKTDS
jgi:hypothetical protein